jgi:hypothetical protein
MAQAEIAANAQRDEEAGTPPPQRSPRQEPGPDDDDELEDEEGDDAAASPEATPADEAPEAEDAAATPEQPKYSRRDAAKFAAELAQHKKDLAEAQQIVQRAQAEVAAHRAADQHIVTQLAEVSGYTREQNGRFRIDNLKDRAVKNLATAEERQELSEMAQWAELAGPIYREAERQVTRAFSVDWNALKTLEGVGDNGFAKLHQAANGVEGARIMHALAYAAGRKAAQAEAKAEIARAKAEAKSSKLRVLSGAPQPAVANGQAVPSGAGWRDRAFKPDGTLNDDFDREVRAGKWLGVDLSSQ